MFILLIFFSIILSSSLQAQTFITTKKKPGAFPVVSAHRTAAICVNSRDFFVVRKAAKMLQKDIWWVTAKKPMITHTLSSAKPATIIIGSIQKSDLIQQLVKAGKVNVNDIKGKWEAYKLQVVNRPVNPNNSQKGY
jgi:hypothetical protein